MLVKFPNGYWIDHRTIRSIDLVPSSGEVDGEVDGDFVAVIAVTPVSPESDSGINVIFPAENFEAAIAKIDAALATVPNWDA